MDQRVPDPHELRFIIAQLRNQTEEFERRLRYAAMNVALLERIARQADSKTAKPTRSDSH
jgi:hypothetical protein